MLFTNLHDTESRTFVFGDHHGRIADVMELDQLDAALQVAGTWGAKGLAIAKQITGANPIDFHGFHITANRLTLSAPTDGNAVDFDSATPNLPNYTVAGADNTFYTAGEIRNGSIDILGEDLKKRKIKLSDLYTDKSFNKEIRVQPNFRKIIDGLSGLIFKIPPRTQVAFNINISAVHRTYGMVKVG